MALVKIQSNNSIEFWRQRYNELVDYITPGSGSSLFKSDFPSPGSAPIADSLGQFSSSWIRFGGELLVNLNADKLDGQHGSFYQSASNLNAGTIPAARVAASSISNNLITNAMAADMSAATVKGRAVGAGTGDPTDLTAAQVVAIVNTADGAGSGLDADLVDGLQTASAETANTVVIRDSVGRFRAANPSAAQDVATKNYVDGLIVSPNAAQRGAFTNVSSGTISLTTGGPEYSESSTNVYRRRIRINGSVITPAASRYVVFQVSSFSGEPSCTWLNHITKITSGGATSTVINADYGSPPFNVVLGGSEGASTFEIFLDVTVSLPVFSGGGFTQWQWRGRDVGHSGSHQVYYGAGTANDDSGLGAGPNAATFSAPGSNITFSWEIERIP